MAKRKPITYALTIILAFCLLFAALSPVTAKAVSELTYTSDARIYSPVDKATYKVNDSVPIRIYAGFIVYGAANWIQVSIEKDGKQVYWNCYNYTETTTEYDLGSFKPTTAGTYTITAGTTNSAIDSDPDSGVIRAISSTRTFTVKATTIKKMKPKLNVERTAKKKVTLTWTSTQGARTQIYRATSKNGKYKLIKTVSKAKYIDKSVSAKKVYFYKIRFTRKENGKKAVSKYSAVQKAGKYKKPAPFAVTLKSTAKGVKITWTQYKGAGYYLVDKSTSSNGEGDVIACCGANELEWVDTEVETGKTYYYRVTAWVGNEDKPRAKTAVKSIKY